MVHPKTILFSADKDEDKPNITSDDAIAYAKAVLKVTDETLKVVNNNSMNIESLTQVSNNTSSPLQSKPKSSDRKDETSAPLK